MLRTVMLPARNEKDMRDVPEATRQALRFVWLHTVDDAVAFALDKPGAVLRGDGFELI